MFGWRDKDKNIKQYILRKSFTTRKLKNADEILCQHITKIISTLKIIEENGNEKLLLENISYGFYSIDNSVDNFRCWWNHQQNIHA